MDPTMTPEERAKLSDVLMKLPSDQLSHLTVILYEDDIYQRLKGSSKEGKVASLISHLESKGDAERFMNLLGRQYPDIDLSWYSGRAKRAGTEETPAAQAPHEPRSIPPEFAERMRQQRPGYDEVFRLTQAYTNLSAEERAWMSKRDIIDRFLMPLFHALGWEVWTVTGAPGDTARPFDLRLEYHDLGVPVEVREFGDELRGYRQAHVKPWGILTNFETIVILDLTDYESPSVKLETTPRSYIADGDEKHDILAARVFYERLIQPSGQRVGVGSPPTDAGSDTLQWPVLEESPYALGVSPQALKSPVSIGDEQEWVAAVKRLMPDIQPESLHAMPDSARIFGKQAYPAEILRRMAPYVSTDQQMGLLTQALQASLVIEDQVDNCHQVTETAHALVEVDGDGKIAATAADWALDRLMVIDGEGSQLQAMDGVAALWARLDSQDGLNQLLSMVDRF